MTKKGIYCYYMQIWGHAYSPLFLPLPLPLPLSPGGRLPFCPFPSFSLALGLATLCGACTTSNSRPSSARSLWRLLATRIPSLGFAVKIQIWEGEESTYCTLPHWWHLCHLV